MKPIKSRVKYTVGSLLFIAGVGGSVFYNSYLHPMMNSEWVYVATGRMDAGIPITAENFTHVLMDKSLVSPGAITNEVELASLYTAQSMSPNQQYTTLDTQPDPFTITPGTEDVPIAQPWIASVSQTLRQGDYVNVVPIVTQQSGQTVIPMNADGAGLDHLLVLSVHTSQNAEVVNSSTSGPQTVGARDNGSGTPSALDLKMTTSQAQALETYIQQKYQLLIVGVSPNGSTINNTPIMPSGTVPTSSTTGSPPSTHSLKIHSLLGTKTLARGVKNK